MEIGRIEGSTHHVHRGPESLPCCCAATADHPIGQEQSAAALALAIRFHETYERLAPSFGYETRPDTKAFNPESANGRLMVAVCAALLPTAPKSAPRPDVSLGELVAKWRATRGSPNYTGDEQDTFRACANALESALRAQSPAEGGFVLPWDKDTQEILGMPCFVAGPIAHVLKRAGRDIPPKAEAEQAFVIHWLMGLYMKHGSGWREVAQAELREADAAAIALRESQAEGKGAGRG